MTENEFTPMAELVTATLILVISVLFPFQGHPTIITLATMASLTTIAIVRSYTREL